MTKKTGAARVSIISNISLVLLKLAAGFWTGSVAIFSEAVHSAMDLLAAVMAYVSVRVADKPADYQHPYGHGKAEPLAALFEGALIVIAGGLIIHQAVRGFTAPEPLPAPGWGALVMLISAAVNIAVSRLLFRVGRETESSALIADAWHLRTDVYTSLGVFAALGGILLGQWLAPDLPLAVLDPLCALLVALMILKAGGSLCWEAVSQLLDHSLTPQELMLVKTHIQQYAPEIRGYGAIKTRRSGSCRVVFMELLVDGDMPVEAAHALGERVTESIREHFPDSQISFHLEPQNKDS